eukprot:Gb_29388 [translate_table: standard]
MVQEQLASSRDNVDGLKGKMMQSIDKASKEEQLSGPQLARLIELHKHLATKKVNLDKDYKELSSVTSVEQQTTKRFLVPPMNQPEEKLLGSTRKEAEAGPTWETSRLLDTTHMEKSSSATLPSPIEHLPEAIELPVSFEEICIVDPQGDPKVQVVTPSLVPLMQAPLSAIGSDTSPLVQYESSPSEANEAECFEVVPPTATTDTTTSSSTLKRKRSKKKDAPPLGSPARMHTR